MRHVYHTNEIAHLWMHKTQHDARNQQGNFYFDGDTIYSYGSHFPIARHVVNGKNEAGVLFTTRGYSSTTSGHISLVHRAMWDSGIKVLRVVSVDREPKRLIEELDKGISDAQRACFGPTGKFRPKAWKALDELIANANNVSEFFDTYRRWTLPESSAEVKAAIDKELAREKRARAIAERQAKIARAKRHAEQMEALEEWKRGDVKRYWFDRDIPVGLRIRDGEVQTSLGATFPIAHAVRGVTFVKSMIGKGWKRNGHTFHMGEYSIDEIEPNGNVRAGCHYVEYSEIERFAALLPSIAELESRSA